MFLGQELAWQCQQVNGNYFNCLSLFVCLLYSKLKKIQYSRNVDHCKEGILLDNNKKYIHDINIESC